VPGALDTKGGRRCHLLLNKRWHLLPSFLSNEPDSKGEECGKKGGGEVMEIFHEKRYFYVQMQKSNLFVTENL
jgi:hypothetical protein